MCPPPTSYSALSPSAANHLYWLGRYVERVYTALGFIRRANNARLDGDMEALPECFTRLGIYCDPENTDLDAMLHRYIYDGSIVGSIRHGLECAYDNSVVLRSTLKSESLSYIHLCRASLDACEAQHHSNLVSLQPLLDYTLAFWGSVSERIFAASALKILMIGKYVEYLDLHMRFAYPHVRNCEAWSDLEQLLHSMNDDIVDQDAFNQLHTFFEHNNSNQDYSPEILTALNRVLMV